MTLMNRDGAAVAAHHVDVLRATVRGEVLGRDDAGYDEARRVWNGYFDRHPGLVVRCAGAADVMDTVKFAARHDIPLAVRGGGHSYPGHSTIDDGLILDLGRMKGLRIDPQRRVAIAEPGLLLAELDDEAYRFGLAVTAGQVSHTGIAGLTLGGGVGWLVRAHGLTLDNLIAADVVLANGELRRASAADDSDLYWAIRGGGGNFGVVTSFEYNLHPQGPCRTGAVVYHESAHASVVEGLDGFIRTAPDRFGLAVGFFDLGEGQTGIALQYVDSAPAEDSDALVDALAGFGTGALMRASDTMDYPKVQQLADAAMVHHRRYYTRSFMLPTLTDDALTMLLDGFKERQSPLVQVGLTLLGGQMARVPLEATAFPHRQEGYMVALLCAWEDEADDAANISWCRELFDRMRPFTPGNVYVNELFDEGEQRIVSAYGSSHYERLSQLKAKYDPDNLFRANQNIKPAAYEAR
ncbi:FAD-binding oxidoreductase [Streptomyces dioscori]|uniref:FAD-binding oxidoreductase n=1 Tax=Streptomyces dioscori TaxID=2109333 RepID=A0A2P8Q9R1_9ACTN|nr:FAD-binding oxidoreductase [Streptomyces dioscori]PSM42983.1 FAD-binding oxidoreductase [Streptomyces dioscori]